MSRRPLAALLTANAVSTTGTTMTVLAIPWFVLDTTGSAARTGVVGACQLVPLVLASALGGPLIDRVGARRAAVWSDLLSAVGVALVPLLHATTGLAFWQLCLLVAVVGLTQAPGDTARAVLLPPLQRHAGVPLERATSAFDGVERGARMVGAPLAGVLIAALGPSGVLLVDAASFLVSALLLASAVPGSVRPAAAGEAVGRYLASMREGLTAVRRDGLITRITVMVMVTNLLDAAYGGLLLPVYARDVLGSSVALGVLAGCFGGGALAGTLVYGVVGPRLPRWPVYTAAFLVVGAPRYLVLAAEPPYPVVVVTALLVGFAAGAINPVLSAVEYERIPEELQSRILGVLTAGVLVGMPVGVLAAGLATEYLGLQVTLVGCAVLYLAATLAPLGHPVWREMDRDRVRAGRGTIGA